MRTPTRANNDTSGVSVSVKTRRKIPTYQGQMHEGETAGAKEVIRIILRRDLMRMPVPDPCRDKRNGSENPKPHLPNE